MGVAAQIDAWREQFSPREYQLLLDLVTRRLRAERIRVQWRRAA
jgi:hypothetical protein